MSTDEPVQHLKDIDIEVIKALENILASPFFVRSQKQSAFLRFVVAYHLKNHASPLHSIDIAVDCFSRPVADDPDNAYVRNIATRTRQSLNRYYNSLEASSEVEIRLPKSGYQLLVNLDTQLPRAGVQEVGTLSDTQSTVKKETRIDQRDLNPSAVRSALKEILSSTLFSQAAIQSKFLAFIVEHHLNTNAAPLDSKTIARLCFSRDLLNDPYDAYVRNIATRTRHRLTDHYHHLDPPPKLIISISAKGYQVSFYSNHS